jgi:hypothetical protein
MTKTETPGDRFSRCWQELAAVWHVAASGAATDDVNKIIMTTQAHTIVYPARTHRSSELLGVTATTYLALAIALGVHAAFYLVVASAVIALWAALCRRFPVVGYFTGVFVIGFIQGLTGSRSYRRR